MIIDNIFYTGIEDVYNYLQEQYKDWTRRQLGGTANRARALNYCEIDFEISDISSIEFMIMKDFAGGNAVYRGSEEYTVETIPEELPEKEKEVITKAINFRNQVRMNSDAPNYVGDMACFPAIDRCKAIVRFTGTGILELAHAFNMTDFFCKWLGEIAWRSIGNGETEVKFPLWEDLHKEISAVKPKLSLKDWLSQGFLTNFYKYWADSIKAQDIVSNAFIHKRSYLGVPYGKAILQEIRSPRGCISLGSPDKESIGTNIASMQEFCKEQGELKLNDILPLFRMTMTAELRFTINVKTSFMTFLKLMKHLPYEMINDYQDMLIVIGNNPPISLEQAENFSIRKGQATKKTWELIESYHGNNPLRMMDFIPYETTITYTLMGSVGDFGIMIQILNEWIGDESDEDLTLDKKEIKDLIQDIDSFILMLSNTVTLSSYK